MTDDAKSVCEYARAMGRKGGAATSPAKRAASAANLARARAARHTPHKGVAVTVTLGRKPTMSEAELREVCKKYLPKAEEPEEPVHIPFDELSQL